MVNVDKGYDYYQKAYDVLEKTGTVDHAAIKSYEPYAVVKAAHGPLLASKLLYIPIIGLGKPGATASICDYKQQLKPVAYKLNFTTALTHSVYQTIPKTRSKL